MMGYGPSIKYSSNWRSWDMVFDQGVGFTYRRIEYEAREKQCTCIYTTGV